MFLGASMGAPETGPGASKPATSTPNRTRMAGRRLESNIRILFMEPHLPRIIEFLRSVENQIFRVDLHPLYCEAEVIQPPYLQAGHGKRGVPPHPIFEGYPFPEDYSDMPDTEKLRIVKRLFTKMT